MKQLLFLIPGCVLDLHLEVCAPQYPNRPLIILIFSPEPLEVTIVCLTLIHTDHPLASFPESSQPTKQFNPANDRLINSDDYNPPPKRLLCRQNTPEFLFRDYCYYKIMISIMNDWPEVCIVMKRDVFV